MKKQSLSKERKDISSKKKSGNFHHGDLRDALIMKTIDILGERSDADFSLRELAKSLGVSHVAVFNHFPSKAHLLAETAKVGFETLGERVAKAHAKSKGISDPMQLYVKFSLENVGLFRAMFHPLLQPLSQFPALEEASLKAIKPLQQHFPSLNAKESDKIALLVWATAHGLVTLILNNQLPGPFKSFGNSNDFILKETPKLLSQLIDLYVNKDGHKS